MSSLSVLPAEFHIQILSSVRPWDYPAVLQVCSLWRSIISSREIQELRHSVFYSEDGDFRIHWSRTQTSQSGVWIHWLLYSWFPCSHCPICISKYESYSFQYPSLSFATEKRIFLTAKLDPASTAIASYQLWIENCTFSPSKAETDSRDFRKIDILASHPLLDETVVSYEQLTKPKISLPIVPEYQRYGRRGYTRRAPINPEGEAVSMAQLSELFTIPEGIPKFRLEYRACFPHCTAEITDKEAPTANLIFPVHPELTVRQLIDLSWKRLRKICYKNPMRNIEKAFRVRFSISGTSEEGFPVLSLDLDVEGICCQEIENLALGGGVWESIFSRFKAEDAGVRYWEM